MTTRSFWQRYLPSIAASLFLLSVIVALALEVNTAIRLYDAKQELQQCLKRNQNIEAEK